MLQYVQRKNGKRGGGFEKHEDLGADYRDRMRAAADRLDRFKRDLLIAAVFRRAAAFFENRIWQNKAKKRPDFRTLFFF